MKFDIDCINCEHWDLYCTLGKEEYYWCRIYNFNRFDLKKSLKQKILKGKHKSIDKITGSEKD